MEAITWHLENPEKYDPSRGTFIKYLKYNILRRMIHNDATSKENRKTRDVFGEKIKDGNDPSDHYDSILPSIEEYFEDNIDYDTIMKAVEKKCENDDIAYKIFYEVCLCGGKRREVCREQKMAEKEYDNGIRRLNTILEEIAIQFQLKTQSL